MSFNFIEVALRHANHATFLQIFQQLSSSGRGGEHRKGKETLGRPGRQTCHTILATESNEVSKKDQSESTDLNSLEDFYTFFP